MRRTISALVLLAMTAPVFAAEPKVEESPFGTANGTPIKKFTLSIGTAKVAIITYGGIVTNLWVSDKDGKLTDVVMGFDTLDGYLAGHPYFGSNVGRCGNRIANAKFSLEGKDYKLEANNGPNSLHGGKVGFDKKVWKGEAFTSAAGPGVKLSYTSPDGEEGYPGTLTAVVTYTLTADNALRIDMSATTDKTTVCNIAHHTYFNLAGHDAGSNFDHVLEIMAKNYTPTDETLIPTGKIVPVAGTPFDFTKPTAIGKRIKEIKADPVGYDLNYALDGTAGGQPFLAVRVTEPKSGRVMELHTDQPGVQFYTGNFLKDVKGKAGATYQQYGAFCLEAQKFPDAINKPDWCKGALSPILKPGEEYKQVSIYKFTVNK